MGRGNAFGLFTGSQLIREKQTLFFGSDTIPSKLFLFVNYLMHASFLNSYDNYFVVFYFKPLKQDVQLTWKLRISYLQKLFSDYGTQPALFLAESLLELQMRKVQSNRVWG